MTLVHDRLPEPQHYSEAQGVVLVGRGAWRTTRCAFHGGSDSMRVNVRSGSFCCMAGCGARGGDALALLRGDALVVAMAAGNLARGVALDVTERQRLLACAARIQRMADEVGIDVWP